MKKPISDAFDAVVGIVTLAWLIPIVGKIALGVLAFAALVKFLLS